MDEKMQKRKIEEAYRKNHLLLRKALDDDSTYWFRFYYGQQNAFVSIVNILPFIDISDLDRIVKKEKRREIKGGKWNQEISLTMNLKIYIEN